VIKINFRSFQLNSEKAVVNLHHRIKNALNSVRKLFSIMRRSSHSCAQPGPNVGVQKAVMKTRCSDDYLQIRKNPGGQWPLNFHPKRAGCGTIADPLACCNGVLAATFLRDGQRLWSGVIEQAWSSLEHPGDQHQNPRGRQPGCPGAIHSLQLSRF
jgi:hypothetical protein